MLYILLFWSSGILLGLFTVSFQWWLSFQIIPVLLLIFDRLNEYFDQRLLILFCLHFFTFSLAVLFASASVNAGLESRIQTSEAGTTLGADVELINFSRVYDHYQSVQAEVQSRHRPHIVTLYWPVDQRLLPGQRWRVTCLMKPPISTLSPGALDYRHYYFIHHIDGQCSVKTAVALSAANSVWQSLRIAVREQILQAPLATQEKAFCLAILTGDKSLLDSSQKTLFRRSQTQHLVVVSGLHLSMLFALVYLLIGGILKILGLLISGFPIAKVRLVAAFAAAWLYAGLCGFPVPTERALVMIAIPVLFILANRYQRWPLALCCAWIIITVTDPLAILQPGTWLSFLAVFILLWGLGFNRVIGKGMLIRLQAWIQPQIIIFLGLTPLLIVITQMINPFSVLINIIAIPLVSLLLLPLGFLCLLSVAMGIQWPFLIFSQGYGCLQWIMAEGSNWAFSVHPAPLSILAVIGLALWYAFLRRLPGGTLFLGLCLITMVLPRPFHYSDHLTVTVLDVGQGQSVFVQRRGEGVLVDTGPGIPGTPGAFGRVVYPFLRSIDMTRLDLVVFSHNDTDHTSGMKMATETLSSPYWLTGEPDQIPFSGCQSGQRVVGRHLTVSILHPDLQGEYHGNAASCVIKISSPDGCVLIPGDAGKAVEYRLTSEWPGALKCDVLVAGHHGSRSSTSAAWLQAVSPQLVLISAGAFNHFGHPHQQTLDALTDLDIPWLSTQQMSSFTVTLNNHEIGYKSLKMPLFPWQGYVNEIKQLE